MQNFINSVRVHNEQLTRARNRIQAISDKLGGALPEPVPKDTAGLAPVRPLLPELGDQLDSQMHLLDRLHGDLYRLEELLGLTEVESTATTISGRHA